MISIHLRASRFMQRKFVTNLALVLTLNLLIKPFWILGIDVAVQNAVGTEQYGFYYALFNFSFLLNILLDLGITSFNNKNISQNNQLLSKHFASIVLLRLLLVVIYAICVLVGGLMVKYNLDMMKMLAAVTCNQILISFILYLRSNLAGLHLFKTDSIVSVLDRLIMIGICGALLYYHNTPGSFQIQWFIYSQTVAYLITALITFALVVKKSKVRRLTWRWPFFMLILKKSYPYAVLVLLMTFHNYIGGVMLERMLPFRVGALQAGIYAGANRLLDASNMIPVLFAGLLLPIFARMIKLRQNVEEMVGLAFSLLVIPAIVVATCCYFFSREIMNLLYKGTNLEEYSRVFKILMCCFIPVAAQYIFGTLLTANGNLKQLNIVACSAMVLITVMNIILIPRYQAFGAAVSIITTQFLNSLAQIIVVRKVFEFKKNISFIMRLLTFVLYTIIINYLVYLFPLFWVYRLVVTALACFALAFALRLISVRNLYRIVKYDE